MLSIIRLTVFLGAIGLLVISGCGRNSELPQASPASAPVVAGGATAPAAAVVESPITSADLNKGMSERQKAIVLSRKNK